jgi:isopentenyl diphosphate isomerase/L-lactate dehydrogenase-like FMN-dependent dehydrogenase
MELPATIAEFERLAAEVLPPGPYGFFAGGAGDEVTLADNLAAWRRWQIRPRVLVDVSSCDRGTVLLGRPRPHPVLVAPTAFHRLAHPDGELATGRAARDTGTVMCLSTFSTVGAAELAAAVPDGTRWFQLYVFRDRGVTKAMVEAAVTSGYEALVVTVDLPVLGRRERDLRSGFAIQEPTAIPGLSAGGVRGPLTLAQTITLVDPSLTWKDLAWLAQISGLPVLVKGVLTAEDAALAAAHGAAGVIVSNHGGRQLDGVPASADALPEVVERIGDQLDVLVDGGVRRGTDVLKALALGARAVLVGRPVLWGLAVAGEAGARQVLELLLAELDNALALAGAPRASQLDRAWLRRLDAAPSAHPGAAP